MYVAGWVGAYLRVCVCVCSRGSSVFPPSIIFSTSSQPCTLCRNKICSSSCIFFSQLVPIFGCTQSGYPDICSRRQSKERCSMHACACVTSQTRECTNRGIDISSSPTKPYQLLPIQRFPESWLKVWGDRWEKKEVKTTKKKPCTKKKMHSKNKKCENERTVVH